MQNGAGPTIAVAPAPDLAVASFASRVKGGPRCVGDGSDSQLGFTGFPSGELVRVPQDMEPRSPCWMREFIETVLHVNPRWLKTLLSPFEPFLAPLRC